MRTIEASPFRSGRTCVPFRAVFFWNRHLLPCLQCLPDQGKHGSVRRQPSDAVQMLRVKPACGGVLPEHRFSLRDPAPEAVHAQTEGRIVIYRFGQELHRLDPDVQFLPDLTDQGLLRRLPGLHLAPGKLPAIFEITVPALGGKELVVPDYDGCYYMDGLHMDEYNGKLEERKGETIWAMEECKCVAYFCCLNMLMKELKEL